MCERVYDIKQHSTLIQEMENITLYLEDQMQILCFSCPNVYLEKVKQFSWSLKEVRDQ